MEPTDPLLARTETLLKQMEDLQEALARLQTELREHVAAVGEHLSKAARRRGRDTQQFHAPAPTTEERRGAPRRRGNPVSVHICNSSTGTDPFQGWVVDRSGGGLRLLVDEAVGPGTLLSVRPMKVHASFPWTEVRVKNCQPERNSWSLGCQFVHKVSWEDLQHFG